LLLVAFAVFSLIFQWTWNSGLTKALDIATPISFGTAAIIVLGIFLLSPLWEAPNMTMIPAEMAVTQGMGGWGWNGANMGPAGPIPVAAPGSGWMPQQTQQLSNALTPYSTYRY